MEIANIADFETLLSDIAPKGKKCINIQITRLTAPGENYGSLMLALTMILQNNEENHLVAKLIPHNEVIKKFMNSPITFRNELFFYQTLLPSLQSFDHERRSRKSLQFFPKFFTGRLSLDPSSTSPDNDAIIVLENLRKIGFVILERTSGFDLDASKLILSKMAELHGTALALKFTRPEIFEEKFMGAFEEFRVFRFDREEEFLTSDYMVDALLGVIKEDKLWPTYQDKIIRVMKNCAESMRLPKNSMQFRQGNFTTFTHGDLWINNIMVKTDWNKVVDVKFLDFQLYEYASICRDVLFFIFTSVQESVLEKNFDELIEFYYENLILNLRELKCDTTDLSFESFQNEMKKVVGEISFLHILASFPAVFAPTDKVFDVNQISKKTLYGQIKLTDICKRRIRLTTRKIIEKNWLF